MRRSQVRFLSAPPFPPEAPEAVRCADRKLKLRLCRVGSICRSAIILPTGVIRVVRGSPPFTLAPFRYPSAIGHANLVHGLGRYCPAPLVGGVGLVGCDRNAGRRPDGFG